MVAPAIVYAVINFGGEGSRGWGIPMATDIAFMLGLLTVLGSRIPVSLKVFFTALAIADDLGAVLVIALFYSGDIHWVALAVAAVFLLALIIVLLAVWYFLPEPGPVPAEESFIGDQVKMLNDAKSYEQRHLEDVRAQQERMERQIEEDAGGG